MRFLLLWWVCLLVGTGAHANGLWLRCVPTKEAQKTAVWVGWQNGWNDTDVGGNHDAAWLFAHHIEGPLYPISVSISIGANRFFARVSDDGRGIWLVPNAGRVFAQDSALLLIDYGLTPNEGAVLRGIEMVYVPPGPFWLGDSASNNTLRAEAGKRPFRVTSDATLHYNQENATLAEGSSSSSDIIPDAFPLGYQGFFCQKYEISQGQWADFVNALSPTQRQASYPTLSSGVLPQELGFLRFGYKLSAGILLSNTSYRATGGLNWQDVLAYLDWACLRPLSETEFEKACRGPLRSVPKEFAWGTNSIAIPADSLASDGTASESAFGPLNPNAGWGVAAQQVGLPYLNGPARQGFAATSTSGRVQAGAGYYGIFELSGNVWEHCVRLNNGSLFDFTAGDGILTPDGLANQPSWLGVKPIVRGGGHASVIQNDLTYPYRDLAVSDRFYLNYLGTDRRSTTGGRGGRSW